MSQNWQDIWNKRSLGSGENILAQLGRVINYS
jgi:hypothetical protein